MFSLIVEFCFSFFPFSIFFMSFTSAYTELQAVIHVFDCFSLLPLQICHTFISSSSQQLLSLFSLSSLFSLLNTIENSPSNASRSVLILLGVWLDTAELKSRFVLFEVYIETFL